MALTDMPWNLPGFHLAGDIGDYTLYTDKNRRKVIYPFSPPHKPPSVLQLHQRTRFRTAVNSFLALPAEDRANLEEACRRASLVMGGCALWTSACLTNSNAALQTLALQTGLSLPTAPYIE
jgi:hypothetical protein